MHACGYLSLVLEGRDGVSCLALQVVQILPHVLYTHLHLRHAIEHHLHLVPVALLVLLMLLLILLQCVCLGSRGVVGVCTAEIVVGVCVCAVEERGDSAAIAFSSVFGGLVLLIDTTNSAIHGFSVYNTALVIWALVVIGSRADAVIAHG